MTILRWILFVYIMLLIVPIVSVLEWIADDSGRGLRSHFFSNTAFAREEYGP